MRVTRTASAAFTAELESETEVRHQYEANLAFAALPLATAESVALHTTLLVTLRGPWGGEAFVQGTVVAALPDGLALAIEGDPEEIQRRLLARPGGGSAEEPPEAPEPEEKKQSSWDRIRGLSQMEKLLLAVKADRSERALLAQDSDPRVLLSLLRNPRLTVDEVVRVAKSSFLTYQIAETLMKSGQWMASLEVRLALIHNPKTAPPFALRILPTLPDSDVRAIARGGTNMALKQAALRRLQGRT